MAIITDKTVISKYAPEYTNVTWIDTSHRPVVIRAFINGKWTMISGDIGDESDDGGDSGSGSGGEGGGGDSGDGGETTPVQTAVSVTYSELRSLRDEHKLVPGVWYRITDYVCTTTQQNTQSANHSFDIIVRADDERRINDNAYATRHNGDTYFANSKLTAWRLKYDLDNDTNYFAWADSANGKGVVYWMVDEFGNECPYDFKNIMFKRFEITAVKDTQNNEISGHDLIGLWGLSTQKVSVDSETSKWFYTFSSVNGGTVSDASLSCNYDIVEDSEGSGAGNNVIKSLGEGKAYLNNIVFINSEGDLVCYGNRFGMDCENITLGDWCTDNTFGNSCYGNTFGNNCSSNIFVNSCGNNTFGGHCGGNMSGNGFWNNTFGSFFESNTFGNNCSNNTFGNSCSSNMFGNYCYNNMFGNYCYDNSFWNDCNNNTFGNNCFQNSLENGCDNNSFGNYCQTITVFDGVRNCSVTGGSQSAPVKNAQILSGTIGASAANKLIIDFDANKDYTQVVAKTTLNDLQVWNPADVVI